MSAPRAALIVAAVVAGLAVGPWLARASVHLTTGDDGVRPSRWRVVGFAVLLAVLLAGVATLTGWRPASLAFAWAAGAGLVLGAVDIAAHRLPDRVIVPAFAVCGGALVLDAAVTGTWSFLLNAALALVVVFAGAFLVRAISPSALGFGDVKLLGLLALLLGWDGLGVLGMGLLLALLIGALASVALVASRRATWTTAVPFGPPLVLGAALAVALTGPIPPF